VLVALSPLKVGLGGRQGRQLLVEVVAVRGDFSAPLVRLGQFCPAYVCEREGVCDAGWMVTLCRNQETH
jgi:hypothetical protein